MTKRRTEILMLAVICILPFLFYGKVLFPGKMLFGTDWLAGTVMQRQYMADMLKQFHQFPLWNTSQFAGIPTGEGFFGDIFYPLSVFLRMFLPVYVVWTLVFILHPVIAGIGTYFFVRNKTQNIYISLFAASAFMLTGVLISEAYGGHDGRIIVVSYLPLLMYFLDMGLNRKRIIYYALAAVPAGMMLLSGHIQSSYYAIVFGVFYVAYIHIDITYEHRLRNYAWLAGLVAGWLVSMLNTIAGFSIFIALIIALPAILDRKMHRETIHTYMSIALFAVLTIMISAVQYLPIMRFMPFAARGAVRDYAYATSWSMGISEIMDLFFPGFTGINIQNINTYWGENPFKLHIRYIGIIPMVLAISAMVFTGRNSYKKFFSLSAVIVLVLALGGNTPLYRVFHSLFPYVDKFRAPELIFFIFAFSMIVLASMFLSQEEKMKKRLIWTVSVIGGIGLLLLLFPPLFESIFKGMVKGYGFPQAIEAQKIENMAACINAVKGSAITGIIFMGIVLAGLLYFDKKYLTIVIIGLSVITAGDLWLRDSKFIIPVDKPSVYFRPDNAVKVMQQDKEDFRIFPFAYRNDDYFSYHGFSSISGNHPSPFADYQKFINNEGSVMFNPQAILAVPQRLKYLSVKYMVTRYIPADTAGYDPRSKAVILQYNEMFDEMGFDRYYEDQNTLIMKSRDYLPRVYFADKYIIEDDIDKALSIIDSGQMDRNTVILDQKPDYIPDTAAVHTAEITAYLKNPNKVTITADCSGPGMLVLTDQYYKAWKCTVDRKPAAIYTANSIFRALKLDKGVHEIVFTYDAGLQIISLLISIIAFGIIIAIFIVEKKYYENSRNNTDV